MCDCENVEIGSYDRQVCLAPPTHMAREDGRGISVDACLAYEVTMLWRMGIKTTGCCCGHNKLPPFIGVTDEFIPAMKALGYVVQHNHNRPGDQDSFWPKSVECPPGAEENALRVQSENVKWSQEVGRHSR